MDQQVWLGPLDCRIIFSRRERMLTAWERAAYRPGYFSREGFIEGLEMTESPTYGGRGVGEQNKV